MNYGDELREEAEQIRHILKYARIEGTRIIRWWEILLAVGIFVVLGIIIAHIVTVL